MPNTYTDNPQASHTLAADQPNIRANFDYIANTLGTSLKSGDHQVSIGGVDTNSFEGRHLQVCLNNRHGAAPTVAGIGDGTNSLIYSDNGNLFFGSATGAGAFQITTYNSGGTFGNATTGWTFFPGGLIANYGKVTGQTGAWPAGNQTINFNAPNINFPTACFSVMVTFIGPASSSAGDVCIISTSTSSFVWAFTGSASASFDGFYWIAIGK